MKLYEIRLIVSLDNATGQHYLTENIGQKTALNYRLLDIQSKTVRGKFVLKLLVFLYSNQNYNNKMLLNYYIIDVSIFIYVLYGVFFYRFL